MYLVSVRAYQKARYEQNIYVESERFLRSVHRKMFLRNEIFDNRDVLYSEKNCEVS